MNKFFTSLLLSLLVVTAVMAQDASNKGKCKQGNCRRGYGVFEFNTGDRYEGDWRDGKMHGQGSYYHANGAVYIGMYKEGERHGYGTYKWPEGDMYIGEYVKNKKEGKGQYIFAAKQGKTMIQDGIFKDNKYVGPDPESKVAAPKETLAQNTTPAQNNNTVEPVAATKGPEVTWLTPKASETVSASTYSIRACLATDNTIKDVKVVVNGSDQAFAQRGFSVDQEAKCENVLKRQVMLQPGRNTITLIAQDDKGTTTSTSAAIFYEQPIDAGVANAEHKTALIIGNASYEKIPLKNAVNDATAMAMKLESLGFKVILRTNATANDMKKAIREFGSIISQNKGVGMFYYAGHGIQYHGDNYMLPVSAAISKQEDIEFEAVEIGRVLVEMDAAKNSMNMVILDACRDNPFAASSRSLSSNNAGLTSIDRAPSGTFIAYSTSPGSVASDGDGGNGLYTQELLKFIDTPNLKLEDMFKKVRVSVKNYSAGQQIPWENSSVEGDFYFNKK